MAKNELKDLLSKTGDKLGVFKDKETFIEAVNKSEMTVAELANTIDEFLTDEEKEVLFELPHFKDATSSVRLAILRRIKDAGIRLRLLQKEDAINGIDDGKIQNLVIGLSENGRVQIIKNAEFRKRHGFTPYVNFQILKSLSDATRGEILLDNEFTSKELEQKCSDIIELSESLPKEETKRKIIDLYGFQSSDIIGILKTFSDSSKRDILINKEYAISSNFDIINLIRSFSIDGIISFLNEHGDFLNENGISAYEISRGLESNTQLELVQQLENTNLSMKDKKLILATLSEETKKKIDTAGFEQQYQDALSIQLIHNLKDISLHGKAIVDLNGNLERYRDLDELITINPKQLNEDEKRSFLHLCEICPNLAVYDDLECTSNTQEYKNAEDWINSVLAKIDGKWTDVQKAAYIHYAIGNRISYSPDFDTEVFNHEDARALWRIIDSGYGVCNGIAQIEQYMLKKVGINAKVVSSGRHSFLKIEDIELPTNDGSMIRGTTIVDATWDLAACRYGAKPSNFCRSYEEIRKHDIDMEGHDHKSHKNDEELADANLDLDEESLMSIFTSIGIADKDGNFRVKELCDKSKTIDDLKLSPEKSIQMQLQLISKYCPQFATCQNSTLAILEQVSLAQNNLHLEKCVASRVYEQNDEEKRPVVYVYAMLHTGQKIFYFANKQTGEFEKLTEEQFVSRFDCYEMDKEKQRGLRPWETDTNTHTQHDLSSSSGIINQEEEQL